VGRSQFTLTDTLLTFVTIPVKVGLEYDNLAKLNWLFSPPRLVIRCTREERQHNWLFSPPRLVIRCTREGRQAKLFSDPSNFHPSHILLIFSSESHPHCHPFIFLTFWYSQLRLLNQQNSVWNILGLWYCRLQRYGKN